MLSSSKQEQLRQLLHTQYALLQQTFPLNRQDALLALIGADNKHYLQAQQTNSEHVASGLQKALSLYFSRENDTGKLPVESLDAWVNATLQACSRLAEAERILAYCDSGFLHMQQGNDGDYNVWVAGKKMPTEWREWKDLEEWRNLLTQSYAQELNALSAKKEVIQSQLDAFVTHERITLLYKTTHPIDDFYSQLGRLLVTCMVAATTYPANTTIGGCTFGVYQDVLAMLIGLTIKQMDARYVRNDGGRDRFITPFVPIDTFGGNDKRLNTPQQNLLGKGRDKSVPTGAPVFPGVLDMAGGGDISFLTFDDTSFIEMVAERSGLDRAMVRLALDAFTLDAENASYHASIMGVPTPPLVRLDEQHRAVSLQGLFTYPLFFLLRELKRKYSYEYHTASQLREEVFRQDVYALFSDRRFVKSAGSVELRGAKGTLTTDVDALIFDRKTGALALFELKFQDPFAYSLQERMRQRDYFYGASKQVIAAHEWVKRNGVNTLLSRLDWAQVKRLKAQKVYIFVLGRYLAHFFDGPPFDTRAAWGTWPQVLRVVQGKPFSANDANPIQSLHNKLMKDTPLSIDKPIAFQEIEVGGEHIRVYPSFPRNI